MFVRPYTYIFFTIGIFFALLFLYTKLAGPIPFYINSVTTQKNEAFTVTGEGEVFVAPDLAVLSAGITAEGPTVKAAREQINTAINKVSEAVKEVGVDAKDIQTRNYNINPSYDYSSGRQRITGYSASTNLSIKVKQIEKVNEVIDAATANGANQVGGVTFEVSDKTKAENEAREKAVLQAKQKAENAAKAGGFSLGRLINYNENFRGVLRPVPMGAVSVLEKADATQIEPGSNEIKVSVTLSYEIR